MRGERYGSRDLRARRDKLCYVRPFVNEHASLPGVRRILIVMCQPFAEFARSDTNDRVGFGVVVRRSPEDLNAKVPLREMFLGAAQSPFRDVAQKCSITLALAEQRVSEKALDLGPLFAG